MVSKSSKTTGPLRWRDLARWKQACLAAALVVFLAGTFVFIYYYVQFGRIIDARLSGEVFNEASQVFAAPTLVTVGDLRTPAEIASRLRRAGYTQSEGESTVGTYNLADNRLEIHPGNRSFFQTEPNREGPAALQFRDGHIISITGLDRAHTTGSYWLEPEVLTTLFDESRSKRRLVRYQDLPKTLVAAVLATEDRRFFSHHGVNYYRIIAAAAADIRADERLQGGSTLTMQLARNFFLTPRRTLRRKVAEIFLALLLEQRLTKEQIFELYANQIYLGQRGSFSIYGFGEAANAYFNKDVSSLTLPESALLAGSIRGPNLYSPYKYPARALERRNTVLRQMLEIKSIKPEEAEKALTASLGLARQNVEATQAPFFVDMIRDQLLAQFSESELLSHSYRVYTTLDLDLQRAASEAVRVGMAEIDRKVKNRKRGKDSPPLEPNQPQVALLALDPHTGALKALVGGRDYGVSQLNHVLARRQPGSSFKPFVYAAALSTAVDGTAPVFTPATELADEPTTFQYGNQPYEPQNYKGEYHGVVTVREALTHSLNVATVRLAEMTGYNKVRNVAVAAGINRNLLATPAMALGAYVSTPLEIAGAYTIFANGGEYVAPRFILAVNDSEGRTLWRSPEARHAVLDPRVSYLMVSLLESVINNGTGADVRARGFQLPAAGKTGTSHDGWFVGFTSNLLAAVWVGYDDDRELKLAGATSALPVWTEFMKRGTQVPAYRNVEEFLVPQGIVTATIDPPASVAAVGSPPASRNEIFIAGTEPQTESPRTGIPGILSRMFHRDQSESPATTAPLAGGDTAAIPPDSAKEPPAEEKRGGILKRFFSIFKGGGSKARPPASTKPSP
jgi:penicillin-binding protein 1B